jgi:hypothetical protein
MYNLFILLYILIGYFVGYWFTKYMVETVTKPKLKLLETNRITFALAKIGYGFLGGLIWPISMWEVIIWQLKKRGNKK